MVAVDVLQNAANLIIGMQLILLIEGGWHSYFRKLFNGMLGEDLEHVTAAAGHDDTMRSNTNSKQINHPRYKLNQKLCSIYRASIERVTTYRYSAFVSGLMSVTSDKLPLPKKSKI